MQLEVRNLNYSVEERQVLKNVQLEIKGAAITAVLGANGSGKSTLLRLIAGLLDPDGGEILFNQKKVIGPAYKLVPGHDGIALVRQDNKLFPLHTVKENLLYVLRAYEETYQASKIEELSQLLSLKAFLNRPLKFLSGGEQQRVSIAAALASDPKLLLMDEPFSQTDMYLKQELKEHLVQVVAQLDVHLLFVTHDPQDALALSNEIMVLSEGAILEKGTPAEIYYTPKHKVTAMLSGYCNWLPVAAIPDPLSFPVVEDMYLIRPDQIQIQPSSEASSYTASVIRTEFCGFYRRIHLHLNDVQQEIVSTQISETQQLKVGQEVWIHLKAEKTRD